MDFFRQHILSIITYTPLVGAFLLLFIDKEKKDAIRWVANIVGFVGLIVSLPLWFWYNRADGGFQFLEQHEWIQAIGATYHFGADGISVLLILLTTVLGAIAILSSWTAIQNRVKEYYIFLLLLQVGMLGVFCALDFFLFYVFWEVMLVPMYFLIGVWGSDRRLYSAIKFFLYTLVGSVVMLLGILVLYFHMPEGQRTFDYVAMMNFLHASPLASNVARFVWLAFFLGFAIKVPMFPFHTWLPDAHTDAPTAGSVILAGVLLKMGTYGFIRFSLPLLPHESAYFKGMIAVLAIVGIIYGALVAMMQKDWKRLVAYSSVSHLGFVMLGMFCFNPNGVNGSVLQMINHGISTGGLFLIVGLVYERRHTRLISEYSGLSHVMPVYATYFMIIMLSSLGLPLLNGFIGEFTILQGAFQVSHVWAAFAVLGIILGAAYLLWLYQRTMFGEITNEKNRTLKDLNFREVATLLPLVILAFWIGIYPRPFFRILEKPVNRVVATVQPDKFALDADGNLVPANVNPAPAAPAAAMTNSAAPTPVPLAVSATTSVPVPGNK
ncbi:MAG: NADH-quinone oxidoreductase subunit M [Acidobacteriia bacterium]|nr:NADH-quinone oxidoreductase subunit M [Terriglobia bacterium]